MRTSEVAARARVNPQTQIVRFVKRAQDLGFALDDIESLLQLAEGGPEGCDAARELSTAKIADLDVRIADLQAMRAALARLVATCEQPRNHRECPILAQITSDPEDSGPEGRS